MFKGGSYLNQCLIPLTYFTFITVKSHGFRASPEITAADTMGSNVLPLVI